MGVGKQFGFGLSYMQIIGGCPAGGGAVTSQGDHRRVLDLLPLICPCYKSVCSVHCKVFVRLM